MIFIQRIILTFIRSYAIMEKQGANGVLLCVEICAEKTGFAPGFKKKIAGIQPILLSTAFLDQYIVIFREFTTRSAIATYTPHGDGNLRAFSPVHDLINCNLHPSRGRKLSYLHNQVNKFLLQLTPLTGTETLKSCTN